MFKKGALHCEVPPGVCYVIISNNLINSIECTDTVVNITPLTSRVSVVLTWSIFRLSGLLIQSYSSCACILILSITSKSVSASCCSRR